MSLRQLWSVVPSFLLVTLPAGAAEADKFIPDDTVALVSLNVRQILDSAVVKKTYLPQIQKDLKGNADLQKLFKDLGFDPFRDIDRIVVAEAESCEAAGDRGEPGLFLVVRGRFDAAKAHAKLAEVAPFVGKLLKIQKAAGGILYEVALEDRSLFFAFPERGTLVVAARKEPVGDALERAAGRKKLRLKDDELRELIAKKTDGKQALWVVAAGGATLQFEKSFVGGKAPKGEKLVRKTLADSGVTEVTGGFWVADGVKAAFAVEVRSEAVAKVVGEALQTELTKAVDKGFDGALDDPRLLPVKEFLKDAIVTGDGKHIVVQGEVAGRTFAKILK